MNNLFPFIMFYNYHYSVGTEDNLFKLIEIGTFVLISKDNFGIVGVFLCYVAILS